MKIELSKLVATIGDSHTNLLFPVDNYLPFKFYVFKDGVYIIKTIEKYKDLLYKKLEAIDNLEINEILNRLKEIIPHENEQFFKAKAAMYLQGAEVLYGLFIIDDASKVEMKIQGVTYEIETVLAKDIKYINEEKLPIYARKAGVNLWYEDILDSEEIYIKYNFCREQGETTIAEKIKEIIDIIEIKEIKKITIDLRNNLGGNSTLLRPLIEYIKDKEAINNKENLKVIIGRETFSSGLLNAYEFKNETKGRIVGEPSGGKPNCYGEILKFTLPNSKFIVSYSTKYYKLIEEDEIMALEPEEYVYEDINDFINLL